MPDPINVLQEKVTGALVEIVKEIATPLGIDEEQIRPGIYGEELDTPSVVVVADSIVESILDSGVYRAAIIVFLSSIAGDTGHEEHNKRIGILTDRMRSSEIASEATEKIDDFHCYQIAFRDSENRREDRSWIYALSLSVVFRPSDVEG